MFVRCLSFQDIFYANLRISAPVQMAPLYLWHLAVTVKKTLQRSRSSLLLLFPSMIFFKLYLFIIRSAIYLASIVFKWMPAQIRQQCKNAQISANLPHILFFIVTLVSPDTLCQIELTNLQNMNQVRVLAGFDKPVKWKQDSALLIVLQPVAETVSVSTAAMLLKMVTSYCMNSQGRALSHFYKHNKLVNYLL